MGITTTGCGSTGTITSGGFDGMILDGRTQSDTDALAFITAASISDSTQQNAIYFLVGVLKYYSLWTKMTACYPFVGGNATAHSKDLKAAYNITWYNTPTQNSNGVTGNGTTQYGDTGLAPSVIGQNSIHLSMYRRTAGNSSEYTVGASDAATKTTYISARSNGNNQGYLNDNTGWSSGTLPSTGFFLGSRIASTGFSFFNGSRKVKAATATSTAPTTQPIYLFALNNNGTAIGFSSTNLAFLSIGSGLSDTDALNLSSIVQAYQNILGRAV